MKRLLHRALFIPLLVSCPLVLLAGCSGSSGHSSSLASITLDESGQAFIAAAEQGWSAERAASMGRLTFPDYYKLLLSSSDDQTVSINGLQIAGVHTWLTHQSASFTAMGATYKNLAAAFASAQTSATPPAAAELSSSLLTALKYLQSDGVAHKAVSTSLALGADDPTATAGKTSNVQTAVAATGVVHRRVLPEGEEEWWGELETLIDPNAPVSVLPHRPEADCFGATEEGC